MTAMASGTRAGIAPVLLACLLITSCTSPPEEEQGAPAEPRVGVDRLTDALPAPVLTWAPCPGPPVAEVECARMTVPLDYHDPGGRTVAIGVSRSAARDPDARRGVLVSNPGGPGVSGLFNTLGVDQLTGHALGGSYDLVGFDPRGVGTSTPLSCGMPPELGERAGVDALPGRFTDDVAAAGSIAEACTRSAADVLPFFTMNNIARDLDMLRKALDEPRLNYYGISGGTTLGTTYSSLFPDHVDRFVLDSVNDDTIAWQQVFHDADPAIDARFTQMAAREPLASLAPTPDAVRDLYLAQRDRLGRERVLVAGRPATPQALHSRMLAAAADDDEVPLFADTLRYLAGLPGAPTEADLAQRLGPDPTAADNAEAEREIATGLAIVCGDTPWSRDPAVYERAVAADARRLPVGAGARANIRPCAFWPAPREPRPLLSDEGHRGDPDVLLVQNEFDPFTPLAGARHTRDALVDRAVMVTAARGGHGVLGSDDCATATIGQWLLDGELPEHDVTCPAR